MEINFLGMLRDARMRQEELAELVRQPGTVVEGAYEVVDGEFNDGEVFFRHEQTSGWYSARLSRTYDWKRGCWEYFLTTTRESTHGIFEPPQVGDEGATRQFHVRDVVAKSFLQALRTTLSR